MKNNPGQTGYSKPAATGHTTTAHEPPHTTQPPTPPHPTPTPTPTRRTTTGDKAEQEGEGRHTTP